MFKSKLQEYCQAKAWPLPEYAVTREGLDHCLSFKAVVEVNGMSFISPDSCRNIKEAQNTAARVAFEHFTGCSNSTPASSSIKHSETQGTSSAGSCDGDNRVTKDNMFKDTTHIYKNQLQIYAQKRNVELPVYSIERVGPCHASCFKSKVTVEGKTYESQEFFRTVKEAESAAAKIALASLSPTGIQEDDSVIYKNLLQELLQKEYSCLPKYSTGQVGLAHMPVFASAVEIQGEFFRGQEAKTKKQAEMNAAKVAYIVLKERRCKKDDNINLLGAHLKGTLELSSAKIPECNDTRPMSDKRVEWDQGRYKWEDNRNVVGAHAKGTPEFSSASIPEIGTSNSSKNVRYGTQPMSNKQVESYQGRYKREANRNFIGFHVNGTPEFSSSNIPEIGTTNSSKNVRSDTQPASDKQVECYQDEGRDVTPNYFARMPGATTNPKSIPMLKTTPSSGPVSSNNLSSSINSEHVNGSNVLDKKERIMVLPKSSAGSPANAAIMHEDDNWIAFTKES